MFSSLLDVGTNIVSTPIPSTQQHSPSARPTHTETEQVPEYATSTHATWFSNPANKIVRGVSMGVSRSVAELQQVGRVATTGLNTRANENASTGTHGQSENIVDDMGTLAGFGKAESPHPDPVSNHLHVPLSGKTADLDDICIDTLPDYTMLRDKENNSTTKPIFHIDGEDLNNEEDDTGACEASVPPTRMFSHNGSSSSATSITMSTLGSSNTSLSSIDFHAENTAPDAESMCGLDNMILDSKEDSPE